MEMLYGLVYTRDRSRTCNISNECVLNFSVVFFFIIFDEKSPCRTFSCRIFLIRWDADLMIQTVLRSRSRWSQNYLRSGAGAEIIFLINIYSSQFGGYLDEVGRLAHV